MSRLEKAFERAKKATMLYRDRATISKPDNVGPVKGFADGNKGRTVIADNVPVTVSMSRNLMGPIKGDSYSVDQFSAVIMLENDIAVPAGAIFEVTDVNGSKRTYRSASKGYTAYQTHQEVAVEYVQQT